jgi:hypothetical protein
MTWDPSVLRKYNTTGHFRLLNQVRSELKDNPLVRPKEGETVGDANRSRALIRLLEGRQGVAARARRQLKAVNLSESLENATTQVATSQVVGQLSGTPPLPGFPASIEYNDDISLASFRARLNAIQMR